MLPYICTIESGKRFRYFSSQNKSKMKISKFNPTSGINAKAHRKESAYVGSYLVVTPDMGVQIDLRIYETKAKTYACVWLTAKAPKGDLANGSGSAGGYGYHLTSAAVHSAFKAAGIEIDGLSGVGSTGIEKALVMVAAQMGHKKVTVFNTHP